MSRNLSFHSAQPGGKCAHLIAARTAVPRLRNQLDGAQHRVLAARFQKAALLVEAVRLARQNRAEIEAETIDMHFLTQ